MTPSLAVRGWACPDDRSTVIPGQPKVSTPRVAYVESDDEYGEDEDAEWQGRSPLYPTVAWDRRERRAHVTNLLGGQWQLHTNDVMGNWN